MRNTLIALAAVCLMNAAPAFAATDADSGEWVYTVQAGDTLSSIAEVHLNNSAAWRKLQQFNKIRNPDLLEPGTSLRIPNALNNPNMVPATVLLVKGEALVSQGAGTPSVALETGAQLRVGSTVETGEGGIITLQFADKSRMLISPKSRVTLTHLLFNKATGESVTRATLEAGDVESSVTPLKGIKARYEVKTPTLNLAVRGTSFRVQLDSKTGLTRSMVTSGEVKAGNSQGNTVIASGYGTTAEAGKGPAKPRTLLPAPTLNIPEVLLDAFPARFSWDALTDAQQYRVELLEGEPTERLANVLTTASSLSKWTQLPNGRYQLRVRGVDELGLEGMNATTSFNVQAWPAPPLLNAPLDKAVVVTEKVNFRWANTKAADFMRFQVAKDPEFKQIAMQVKNLTSRSTGMSLALKPGSYYWRIAAGSKEDGLGPFGPVQSFEVKLPEGTAVALAETASNVLRWRARMEGERYKVQVAREDNFADPLIDTTQNEPEVALPDSSGPVFVQIKRIDPDGFPGEPEMPQYFDPKRN